MTIQWETVAEMPHARINGVQLRIRKIDGDTYSTMYQETFLLELLTDRGWTTLHEEYHYYNRTDERESKIRQQQTLDRVQKYAEYIFRPEKVDWRTM